MRPVSKGNRPNSYPFSVNPAAGYNTTWLFSAVAIDNLYNTYTPTVDACLQSYVIIAKCTSKPAQINKPQNYADILACKKFIDTHIADGNSTNSGYKNAAAPLMQALGPFCSYCESPLSGNIDVEHVCPKKWYPYYSVDWNNFVLACTACNSNKSSTPTRVWTVANLLNNTQPNDESGYITALRSQYAVWPDGSNGPSYLALQPMITVSTAKPTPPPQPYASGQSVQSVDYASSTVMANMYAQQNGQQLVSAQAWVLLNARGVQDQNKQVVTTQGYANQTITLCGLNQFKPSSVYDRRVLNQTVAWFTALQQYATLQLASNQQTFEVLWGLTLKLAAATGFFSVWLKILIETQAKDPKGNLLAARLITDGTKPMLFPGTSWNNNLQAI